ncbi:hypothetical protein TNCV_3244681 [Trichonephila clavipes]|nr:hypothetical protein TNCV_3244681 [Trichonephila clavipes]
MVIFKRKQMPRSNFPKNVSMHVHKKDGCTKTVVKLWSLTGQSSDPDEEFGHLHPFLLPSDWPWPFSDNPGNSLNAMQDLNDLPPLKPERTDMLSDRSSRVIQIHITDLVSGNELVFSWASIYIRYAKTVSNGPNDNTGYESGLAPHRRLGLRMSTSSWKYPYKGPVTGMMAWQPLVLTRIPLVQVVDNMHKRCPNMMLSHTSLIKLVCDSFDVQRQELASDVLWEATTPVLDKYFCINHT